MSNFLQVGGFDGGGGERRRQRRVVHREIGGGTCVFAVCSFYTDQILLNPHDFHPETTYTWG